jgi:hypothetical protein
MGVAVSGTAVGSGEAAGVTAVTGVGDSRSGAWVAKEPTSTSGAKSRHREPAIEVGSCCGLALDEADASAAQP